MKKNKKAGNAMLSSISDLLIAGDERIELLFARSGFPFIS
jgi:hypothetical protein